MNQMVEQVNNTEKRRRFDYPICYFGHGVGGQCERKKCIFLNLLVLEQNIDLIYFRQVYVYEMTAKLENSDFKKKNKVFSQCRCAPTIKLRSIRL